MYYDIIKSAINGIAQLIDLMVCSLKGSDYMANKPERKIPAKEKPQYLSYTQQRVHHKSPKTTVFIKPINEKYINRLNEIASLKDGWLDGNGCSINADVIALCKTFLHKQDDNSGRLYRIYPVDTGGIMIEFGGKNGEVSVELEPNKMITVYSFSDLGNDEIDDKSFSSLSKGFFDYIKMVL